MGSLEIVKIDEIAFATCDPLERDEVGKRADRGLGTIDATYLRAARELSKTEWRRQLSKQVKLTVRCSKMNRPPGRNCIVWNRRSVRAGRRPLNDQPTQALEIPGLLCKDHVDVASGTDHSVTNQRYPTDEHIADAYTIEILENPPETAHRSDRVSVASSIALRLKAIPSASSSSGSRAASLIRR